MCFGGPPPIKCDSSSAVDRPGNLHGVLDLPKREREDESKPNLHTIRPVVTDFYVRDSPPRAHEASGHSQDNPPAGNAHGKNQDGKNVLSGPPQDGVPPHHQMYTWQR